MLNQVVLVGRIVRDPEIRITKTGRNLSYITLAVNRNYKNPMTGLYDTDFISCTLWGKLAINVVNHCKKGSIVGIRGRLATRPNDDPATHSNILEVVADRVSFISHPYRSTNDGVGEFDHDEDELEFDTNEGITDQFEESPTVS